jgi:ribosomal subunit interface protein
MGAHATAEAPLASAYTFAVNLILSGRGVQLDDRLRQYATDKLSRVERFFDRIIKMEVELRHERTARRADRHRVEVTVKTPRETLRAHGDGVDYFAAIDIAADRLETQIKKFKSRLRDHAHRNGQVEMPAPDDGDDLPNIVRVRRQAAKPVTAEEAMVELDDRGMNFLLFTDAETMRASVIFRRADGGYGVIEHET